MHLETLLQHLGEEDNPYGAVTPPIVQTSLFTFDSVERLRYLLDHPAEPSNVYSRMSNPTTDVVEKKIAALEGTEAAKVYTSGITAITCTILNVVETGAHIVTVDTCYKPVKMLLDNFMPRMGISKTYVDGRTVESILDAIRPETKLIYLESPSTAIFRLQDIETVCKEARSRGISTIIDNTYATPLLQNPAALGVDYVCHSASKYMGGHSDLIAGVVCCNRERHARLMDDLQFFGSALPPFPAWLLMRGLRTLPLRIKRHGETAQAVAEWLEARSDVEKVNHVGLASYGQKELFAKQMRGCGGLLSFEPVRQEEEFVVRFVNALEIYQVGVSWGGHESLAIPFQSQPIGYSEPRWFVRLYCGLEHPGDLIADLEQAFAQAG